MRVLPGLAISVLSALVLASSCTEPVLVLWDDPGRAVLEARQTSSGGLQEFFRSAGMGVDFHTVKLGEDLSDAIARSHARLVIFVPPYYNDIKKYMAEHGGVRYVMIPDSWATTEPIASFSDDKTRAVEALALWVGRLYDQGKLTHVFFCEGSAGQGRQALSDAYRRGAGRSGVVQDTGFAGAGGSPASGLLRAFLYSHANDEDPGKNLVVIVDAVGQKEIWELLTGYKGKLASDMDLRGIFPSQVAVLKPDLNGALPSLKEFMEKTGGANRIIVPWNLFISDWPWITFR